MILEDSGAVDSALSRVGKSARVEDAGSYTVSAACVGASDVHLVIGQDPRTGLPSQDQAFDCSTPYARVVQLQPGRVTVQVMVMRPYSGATASSTDGGAAAVRVTAGG
ncbi:hypothetical protein [Arthrobacter bambusae]|uniref:hypothetical protein n=1 Tax=Arthrobacter bambusae TaxID=1338426 RepID=UPI002784B66D|nr:hypothetical protein [Arthrobacter bambusae]MDQ0031620.1 hypothetical protein [Arthrobacter bambusae]MDQ0099844.1 hypothetical protein [Arthrobacter bambusae]